MSAKAVQFKDKKSDNVYPITASSVCYRPNDKITVEDELAMIVGGNTKTEFKSDGSIVETMEGGVTSTTVFGADGSIIETIKDAEGTVLRTTTTKFAADGTITEVTV